MPRLISHYIWGSVVSIRRTRTSLEEHYTQLDNQWLRDGRLSLKARGLFAQILSHREGWSISIASLVRANPEGSSAIRSALDELIEHGYLIRGERERDESGRLGDYEYTLWADKGLPVSGPPVFDEPTSDNPTQDNRPPKKTITQEDHSQEVPPVAPRASSTRGSRLVEGWRPKPETVAKAKAERADVDLEWEHKKFEDHWLSVAGARAVKVDWDRTWLNWIRNARATQQRSSSQTFAQQRQQNSIALVDRYRREEEARGEIGAGNAADVRSLSAGR